MKKRAAAATSIAKQLKTRTNTPVDAKIVYQTLTELNNEATPYEGQIAYVVSEKMYYVCTKVETNPTTEEDRGVWHKFRSLVTGNVFIYDNAGRDYELMVSNDGRLQLIDPRQ